MRSGCESTSIALSAVTLDLGLLPEIATIALETTNARVSLDTMPPLAQSIPPDLPPPRT